MIVVGPEKAIRTAVTEIDADLRLSSLHQRLQVRLNTFIPQSSQGSFVTGPGIFSALKYLSSCPAITIVLVHGCDRAVSLIVHRISSMTGCLTLQNVGHVQALQAP